MQVYLRHIGQVLPEIANEKRFTSPSQAGAHAQKRRSCNGWVFWQYERAPGDWVLLNNLRK